MAEHNHERNIDVTNKDDENKFNSESQELQEEPQQESQQIESSEEKNDSNKNDSNKNDSNKNESNKNDSNKNGLIRENLVSTAVYFLQNPKVAQSPLTQKRLFLLKKGLSNEEIDLAIERANQLLIKTHLLRSDEDKQQSSLLLQHQQHQLQLQQQQQPHYYYPDYYNQSIWMRTTNLASSLGIISGVVYAAYIIYNKYIKPKLFPWQDNKHPLVVIQEQIGQLLEASRSLEQSLAKIEMNIKKQIELEIASYKPYQDVSLLELKNDLASVKALLLNRRQFAATPVPTIPSWQMENNNKQDKDNKDKDNNIKNDNNKNTFDADQNTQINGFNHDTDGSDESLDESLPVQQIEREKEREKVLLDSVQQIEREKVQFDSVQQS